jgi:hypothetical protein
LNSSFLADLMDDPLMWNWTIVRDWTCKTNPISFFKSSQVPSLFLYDLFGGLDWVCSCNRMQCMLIAIQ